MTPKTAALLVVCGVLTAPQMASADSMFPIWGDEVRAQGIELPLPYGISLSHTTQDDVTVSDNLRLVTVDGEELPIDVLSFGDSYSDTDVTSVRFDLWLLPFLNVYAIAGELEGTANQTITIEGRFKDNEIEIDQDFEGNTYGAGATLAYGYESFIASLDINYSTTNLDVVDSEVETLMITPRVGYRSVVSDIPYSIMVGASYVSMDQTLTIEDEVNGETVTTLIDTDSKKAWNTVVTAALELTPQWHVVVDAGFNDRETLTGSLTYRF